MAHNQKSMPGRTVNDASPAYAHSQIAASIMKASMPAMAKTFAIDENFLPAAGILAPNVMAMSCVNAAMKKQKMSMKLHQSVRSLYVKHRQSTTASKSIDITSFDLCIIIYNLGLNCVIYIVGI